MIVPDTSYLVGLVIKRDKYALRSKQLYEKLKYEKLLINNTILAEFLNSFKESNYVIEPIKVINVLLRTAEIDYLNEEDYLESLEIFKYYNHAINFSDCTILKTMEKNKVNKIVSFDKAFDKVNGIKRIY